MGGSCNRENNCEIVNLSQEDQGCGIKGTRVLDSIINTPASQTELVAHFVQVDKFSTATHASRHLFLRLLPTSGASSCLN